MEYFSQCILLEWLGSQEDIIQILISLYFDDLADTNEIITRFAIVGRSCYKSYSYIISFIACFTVKKSPQNPWRSNTLEWTASVKHIHGNWPGEIPEVL